MKSDEYKKYLLGDVMVFKNGKKRPSGNGNIPVYGGNGILGYTNDYNNEDCIIIGRVGAYCGSVYREENKCWVSDNAICGKTKENIEYLYYLLKLLHLNKRHIGTSQPLLTQEILSKIEIILPDLKTQQRVASILKVLDDKIALNQQINNNLEQQLFVLYDNIVSTSACFNMVMLSELCNFQEGYVNPAQTHPEYFDGQIKWLRAVDINESFIINTSRTLTRAGFESAKKSALLFKPNTIAISKSGTIGRLGILADYMCGNRAVINIAPHDTNMLPFIYCFLKSKQREFPDMAVGSVQKNLYVSLLEPLTVAIPESGSLNLFNTIGTSLFKIIYNKCIENEKLSRLRDVLLPKLMSGEISFGGNES